MSRERADASGGPHARPLESSCAVRSKGGHARGEAVSAGNLASAEATPGAGLSFFRYFGKKWHPAAAR